MIKLTKAEAQRTQAEHIEWYGRTYGLERVGRWSSRPTGAAFSQTASTTSTP